MLSSDFGPSSAQPDSSSGSAKHPDIGTMAAELPSITYRGLTLDRFQAEAIAHASRGFSVLVSAPTGTGKTIIADFVVDEAMQAGRDVIYTAPIKALSNQKYRDYTRLYGTERVGLVTGDLVINQDAPLRIMTTEILRNILLQGGRSDRLSHVIVDEVHFLDDEERGTVWEEVLIYLPKHIKIIALSATLPNIYEFADWLSSVRSERVQVVQENHRAIPLQLMMANTDVGVVSLKEFERQFRRQEAQGRVMTTNQESGHRRRNAPTSLQQPHPAGHRGRAVQLTRHVDMVQMVSPDYLPILYFVFSRRQTELFARELTRVIRRSFLDREDRDRVDQQLDEFNKIYAEVLTAEHRDMYRRGIAFHHAGLHVALKALVESLYEQKLVRVLYCTSTFALGINMPARSVLFEAIRKFNGESVVPLTVRQFLQKAGRAGRRGFDTVGYVIVREDFHDYAIDRPFLDRYARGEHERIQSAFNLSFSSVISLLHRHTDIEIRQFLDKSFLNFRYQQEQKIQRLELEGLRQKIQIAHVALADGNPTTSRESLKRMRKSVVRLERDLDGQKDILYERFQDKLIFLKSSGYIEDDGSFNAGANALMHIQINEILVTELLLEGVFEEVDEDELFGLLTGLVQDLPRSVVLRDPSRGRLLRLRERVRRIKESETVRRSAELMGLSVTFCPELIPFGHLWAEGKSLAALMLLVQSDTDVSGDLVGAFRRAKDLAGQLREACVENELLVQRLTQIMRKVSRDEVEVLD